MKALTIRLLVFFIGNLNISQGQPNLSFFKLPVLEDSVYKPGEAYVSCNFQSFNRLSIKNYTGHDEEIHALSVLLKFISSGGQTGYMAASDNTDSTLINSFNFYNFFVPHSKNPSLICRIGIGNYKIFFVRLEDGFPLITFCLLQKGNSLLNHPSILQHPAITALTQAINTAYRENSRFKPLTRIPQKNTRIYFDTAFNDYSRSFAFYFDMAKPNVYCNSLYDSMQPVIPASTAVIGFYCRQLKNLSSRSVDKYLANLSERSKIDVKASIKNISQDGMDYFIKFNSSDSLVSRIIDLGQIKLLLAKNPKNEQQKHFHTVYIISSNKGMKQMNVNHGFYFDDLLLTKEFENVLYD
jgi:hypothetical protein